MGKTIMNGKKMSVWSGGAAAGPVAATTVGAKKQGKTAGKSSPAGKGASRSK
jgi:hypothetical protein